MKIIKYTAHAVYDPDNKILLNTIKDKKSDTIYEARIHELGGVLNLQDHTRQIKTWKQLYRLGYRYSIVVITSTKNHE